ncbi:MAG: hypothetical protein KC983_10210, partial [Phycisphaerales bacterium]|nr:hypothetical protein [Phycisphaerales bacterium]
MGGDFLGDDVPCSPEPCPAAGAFCIPDEGCEEQFEATCLERGGCYVGDGTVCDGIHISAIDVMIPDNGATLIDTQSAPNLGVVDGVSVYVDIEQAGLDLLRVELEHGGVTVTLFDGDCDDNADDIRAVFRDGGTPIADGCSITGIGLNSPPDFDPNGSLADFDGLEISGEWNLLVTYAGPQPCGTLRRWDLVFDNAEQFFCTDCNANGLADFCETMPIADPLINVPAGVCADARPITTGVMYTGDTDVGPTSDVLTSCGLFSSYFGQ